MKKILPVVIFFFTAIFVSQIFVLKADAQAPTPTPAVEGTWYADSEVTFVGKAASRADSFLNWAIANYDWICVQRDGNGNCDNSNNPVIEFWKIVRNIVYAFLALFVLATAFLIIITRGKNITFLRFLPRFIFVFVLITFSFALVQFLYQIVDAITGFFFKPGGQLISSKDLLFVGFDYSTFTGYRRAGAEFDESAFISLLLVRLTAITYYVMTGMLLIRKIILWFFIVVSPIFPILLFYSPIRNTAKIWIGEFFRWLLYAPLFAIFLHGVVVMWRSPAAIPLHFPQIVAQNPATYDPRTFNQYYPTAINILLGGPGQAINYSNSVNINDTFALYVVALLMLWVVILLPFLLLKIFLDYLNTVSWGNNYVVNKFKNRPLPFIGKGFPPSPSTPPPSPGLTQPTGMARALPFMNKRSVVTSTVTNKNVVQSTVLNQQTREILQQANLSIPKMRDVARYESSLISNSVQSRQEVTRVSETLQKIANPTLVTTPVERERVTSIREKLVQERQKGNPLATQILSASSITTMTSRPAPAVANVDVSVQVNQILKQIANPHSVMVPSQFEHIKTVKEKLVEEKAKGNRLAEEILTASEQVNRRIEQKQTINEVSETLIQEKEKGNTLAQTILSSGVPVADVLRGIQNPNIITNEHDRTVITSLKETIEKEKEKGNTLATQILKESESFSREVLTEQQEKEISQNLVTKLKDEKEKGNILASSILPEQRQQSASVQVPSTVHLPSVNSVQQVSIEEYEEVRKMWQENYRTLDVPKGLDGTQSERSEWIQNDIDRVTNAISLLTSQNPEEVKKGMETVASILPFLLIGGFSKSEVVTYLKAKLEAGKSVLDEIKRKEDEEETLLDRSTRKTEAQKEMTMEAKREIPKESEGDE